MIENLVLQDHYGSIRMESVYRFLMIQKFYLEGLKLKCIDSIFLNHFQSFDN